MAGFRNQGFHLRQAASDIAVLAIHRPAAFPPKLPDRLTVAARDPVGRSPAYLRSGGLANFVTNTSSCLAGRICSCTLFLPSREQPSRHQATAVETPSRTESFGLACWPPWSCYGPFEPDTPDMVIIEMLISLCTPCWRYRPYGWGAWRRGNPESQ